MKKITLISALLLLSLGYAQSLPLDFESSTTPYPFIDFDGGVATKISNPYVSGINVSANVMQIVKGAGAVWAGSKITMAAPLDLTTERVFKVKVLSPVAGKKLLLKFEGAGSSFEKLSAPITTANVWEELTFDFSSDAVNNVNNQIVFIFDMGTQGDGSPSSTYLFDDITQMAGTGPVLQLPELPLDFESTLVSYPFVDFAGGNTTVIPNPQQSGINTSATVAQMIKFPGEVYGGSIIQMANPIDFSTSKIIKLKVWSPVAGKTLRLKFEGSPVDPDYGAFEKEAIITNANIWEELTFDYNVDVIGMPVNNNDNKIVFFFDFGTQGDGGPNSTYLFDDIHFAVDLKTTTFETSKIKMYPNPVANQLIIESEKEIQKITIYTVLGQEVVTQNPYCTSTTLQTNTLQNGVYFAKINSNDKESTLKFIKE